MGNYCGNKVKHMTLDAAKCHAEHLGITMGAVPACYLCAVCDWWHVGYKRDAKMSKRARRKRKYGKGLSGGRKIRNKRRYVDEN